MQPNPVLKKLGFAPDDRLAIIHTDDIGMCQASVAAFAELWEFGTISSAATMVPCPWFPEAAALYRKLSQPGGVDMGVHLTLTSEWETYRWGPISTRDPLSGLIDPQGFFYRSSEEAQTHGETEAVMQELQAQIDRARDYGIDPTHIDTHMGSVAHPKFMPGYLQLAFQNGLPPMIMRMEEEEWLDLGLDHDTVHLAMQMVSQVEEMGLPLLDHLGGLDLNQAATYDERLDYARQAVDQLKPGITHFIIHPSKDTPELRAITPDWPYRVADYNVFGSDAMSRYIQQSGIHVIGYQALKDLMPPLR